MIILFKFDNILVETPIVQYYHILGPVISKLKIKEPN